MSDKNLKVFVLSPCLELLTYKQYFIHKFVGMCTIYFHIKFHIPVFNGTLLITVKLKAK